MSKKFHVGDEFHIPTCDVHSDDIFIVTGSRPWGDGYILDAVCDGDESIAISINSKQVERF